MLKNLSSFQLFQKALAAVSRVKFSNTHLSLSTVQDLKDYSEHEQSWLQRQISICTLNHHSEPQTYFLSLVIAYNSDSRLQS